LADHSRKEIMRDLPYGLGPLESPDEALPREVDERRADL
jgi:hypothetical protein